MLTFQEVIEQAVLNGITEVPVAIGTVPGGTVTFNVNVPNFGWGRFSVIGGVITSEEGHWTFPVADLQDDCCEGAKVAHG